MGKFIKNIAGVSKEPAKVSLASNPNFIEFESLGDPSQNVRVDISLTVLDTSVGDEQTQINIVEAATQTQHSFRGTRDKNQLTYNVFYIDSDPALTAFNIKEVFMSNSFFKSNFNITIPFTGSDEAQAGSMIHIESVGSGSQYAFYFSDDTSDSTFIQVTGDPQNTSNTDTILAGDAYVNIILEVYRNMNTFLGMPVSNNDFGVFIIDQNKAYNKQPIWFNVNSLSSNWLSFSNEFMYSDTWVDAGTVTALRFLGKRSNHFNTEPFYISDVYYSLNGYARSLSDNGLASYVYDVASNNIVKPLTRQPHLFYIRGQQYYFNFILSDPDHNTDLGGNEYNFGILYKLYTQSKAFLKDVHSNELNRRQFHIVNTLKLDIEEAIGDLDVGYIEICLSRDGQPISEALTFSVLPECLYQINDFAFLNSLGGWDAFNFSGAMQTDFNSKQTTIYKTQLPDYTVSSQIEATSVNEVTEQFTATTMPVAREVADWLKELSASRAVYEISTKRNIIIDDFRIRHNSNDDLFILEMKYHYSGTFNNRMS